MRRHRLLQLLAEPRIGLVAVLVIFTLLKGLVWIALLPPFQIADEPAHFDDVQYRAEHDAAPAYDGRVPRIEPVMHLGASTEVRALWWPSTKPTYFSDRHTRELAEELDRLPRTRFGRDTDGQATAMAYRGLYYSLAVPIYDVLAGQSVVTRICAIRCLSLLFGLCAVLCTYFAACFVVDDLLLAFAAALLVALQPMESQMTVAVNNDAGVIGLGGLLFYVVMRSLAALPRWPDFGTIVTALCACLAMAYTKPTGFGIFLVVVAAGLVQVVAHRRERRVQLAAAAFGVLAVLASAWIAHRGLDLSSLLPGDSEHPVDGHATDFVSFLEHVDDGFYEYLLHSAWGSFGWLDYTLADSWIPLLRGVFRLMVIGTITLFGAWSLRAPEHAFWASPPRLVACILTVIIGITFVLYAEYRFRLLGVQVVIQGRAFLYVLPPFAIWTVVSIAALVPARARRLSAAILVSGAVLLHGVAILYVVRHHYAR